MSQSSWKYKIGDDGMVHINKADMLRLPEIPSATIDKLSYGKVRILQDGGDAAS
jgi:hypothetical protein